MPNIVSSLLLIEMANTFDKSLGVMGQLRTISSLTGIAVALLLGFMSIKYRYKSLLLTGMTLVLISATGFLISSSFTMIMVFYSLLGIGASIVGPMNNTLLGQHIPVEKRATYFGYITGAAAFAYLVGSPTIAYISDLGGWQLTYRIFIIPLILVSLLLGYRAIPLGSPRITQENGVNQILAGYRAVLNNKSAVACLMGNMVSGSIWLTQLVFSSSYVRTRFLVSKMFISYTSIIGASLFIAGSLICGRLVSRFGRKSVTMFACVPSGLLLLFYYLVGNVWVTFLLGFLSAFSNGVLLTASGSLILEQVPEFRGTMMSLSSAVGGLGGAIGVSVVGWLIGSRGFSSTGFYMFISGVVSAIIYYYFVEEPIQ
jgi:predicted MFS family arabinose efflux permease